MDVRVVLNNSVGKLEVDSRSISEIANGLRFRNPNTFFIRKKVPGYDGYIYPFRKNGTFDTGFYPEVYNFLVKHDLEVEVEDKRSLPKAGKIPKKIGKYEFYKNKFSHQREAVESIVNNKVGDILFPRGVINAATNAGKSIIMSIIYYTYNKVPTIMIINDSMLYDQFKREFLEFIPEEEFGYMRGSEIKWGNFMLVMVKTLSNKLALYADRLFRYKIVLVDECDLSDNKTYKGVLKYLYQAPIKIGLSGSVFLSKLKKDLPRTVAMKCLYGNELFKVKSEDLIKSGVSTPIKVKVIKYDEPDLEYSDYDSCYKAYVTNNLERHEIIFNRVKYNLETKKSPLIIVCQFHDHVEGLYKYLKGNIRYVEGGPYVMKYAHHKVKNKKEILESFRVGEIDILIISYIVRRGKNLPLIKTIINASANLSWETVLQIVGRGLRKHKSKKVVYLEDIHDKVKWLGTHSRKRVVVLKNEKFPVYEVDAEAGTIKKIAN